MLNDLRHGVRMLLQAKGWTLVVAHEVSATDPDSRVRLAYVGRNDMVSDERGRG